MFDWIRGFFKQYGGVIESHDIQPCIGCQQAQLQLIGAEDGELIECHLCKCVWAKSNRQCLTSS